MRIPFDLHTHCTLSFDGISGADEMAARAYELGAGYYALTDHIDLGDHPDPEFDLDKTVGGAKAAFPALKEKYNVKMRLIWGVELGQPHHEPERVKAVLSRSSYDFVIGSVHNIRGYEDFYFLDYAKLDVTALLDAYFDELLEMAEQNLFDIMAHITYPLRYISGEYGINVDMTRYGAVLDETLRTLIKNGKGIEINTSGLRQRLGRTMPDLPVVKRFRELGGEVLSIGSDAHRTDDLGAGIAEGIEIAKAAGFDRVTAFIERKPTIIKI